MDAFIDPEINQLQLLRQEGYNYRERRHEPWRENYTLYRDTVQVNRLTQRQSVNMPLMKTAIKTILKDIDDMPIMQFESLDNDKQKELFLNEYWRWTLEMNKAELFDLVDKKQEGIYGRSFDQMQIGDGRVLLTGVDPEDIYVSRFMDPTNIDSSRFLLHFNIYEPLSNLEKNPDYDPEKVKELKMWHASEAGLIKNEENRQALAEKNEKLSDMGLQDVDSPILSEMIVSLEQFFVYDRKDEDSEEELFLKVLADDHCILLKKPLEEVIGITKDHYWRTHFPYNSWADDLERQDFWSDGIADIVRTPNKVLNSFYSQLVENRTLRNFGMHYHKQVEGFSPQSFQPRPWGFYGIPAGPQEKIEDVIQKVDIPDLSESLDEMEYIVQMVEKASGATSTQQGAVEQRKITLGEVQLALGEAKERIKGISKFYTQVWKERAEKFLKLIEASPDKLDAVKLYKKGLNNDKLYMREVAPSDWHSKTGYVVRIWSRDEKNNRDADAIEKTNAVKNSMPDNPKVDDIFKRRLLEFAEFTPDEVNEALQFERDKREQMQKMAELTAQMGGMPGATPLPPGMPGTPAQPQQPVLPAQNNRLQ